MPSRIPPDAGTDPCWECGIHICVCAGWSFSVQGQGIPAALRSLPEEDPVMASKRTALRVQPLVPESCTKLPAAQGHNTSFSAMGLQRDIYLWTLCI